jgi:hypothetical protein
MRYWPTDIFRRRRDFGSVILIWNSMSTPIKREGYQRINDQRLINLPQLPYLLSIGVGSS